jgi:hypothetical protein
MPGRDHDSWGYFLRPTGEPGQENRRQEPRGTQGEAENGHGEIISWDGMPVKPYRNEKPTGAYVDVLYPPAPDQNQVKVFRKRQRGLLVLIGVLVTVVIFLVVVLVTDKPSPDKPVSASATTSATAFGEAIEPTFSPSASPNSITQSIAASTPSDSSPVIQTPSPSTDTTPPQGVAYLGPPIDSDGGTDTGVDKVISNVDYSNSTTQSCPTDGAVDWDSAGYSTFTAMVGIADDEGDATGETATVKFLDEDNGQLRQVKVSLGDPEKVTFSLDGAVRMEITCTASPGSAYDFDVTLGNAAFSN